MTVRHIETRRTYGIAEDSFGFFVVEAVGGTISLNRIPSHDRKPFSFASVSELKRFAAELTEVAARIEKDLAS